MLSFQTVQPDTLELLKGLMRLPMSYFTDADPQAMPYMFENIEWDSIKQKIKEEQEVYNSKHNK